MNKNNKHFFQFFFNTFYQQTKSPVPNEMFLMRHQNPNMIIEKNNQEICTFMVWAFTVVKKIGWGKSDTQRYIIS